MKGPERMKPRPALKTKSTTPIPACTGVAFHCRAGEYVKLTDIHGGQVGDLWAFNAADPTEYLSTNHTMPHIGRMFPLPGQSFFTNRRRPILQLVEDTAGVHDMLMAACDPARYRMFGVECWHPSCAENLRNSMAGLGFPDVPVPQPVNFFEKSEVDADGALKMVEAPSKAGDYVVLKAWIDCVVSISACPADFTPVSGWFPTDLSSSILCADAQEVAP
jgi:uncharacterized protein YcgI (DUF1989 family)